MVTDENQVTRGKGQVTDGKSQVTKTGLLTWATQGKTMSVTKSNKESQVTKEKKPGHSGKKAGSLTKGAIY
jgi:hypothetical protein